METKIIKITNKGQISIPIEIRKAIGFSTGDELIAIREGDTLCLKKVTEDDFRDLLKLSEKTLKKMWDNQEDEIWNNYIK